MILVSSCLTGEPCRMDGKSKPVPGIVRLYQEGRAVRVCPEVLGGLSIPRTPCERLGVRVLTASGEDRTAEYTQGARAALAICHAHACSCAILKSKSPSCGIGCIHSGLFDGQLVPGNGIFGEMLLACGVPACTESDDWESMISTYDIPQPGAPGSD